jgi:phospholipase/carboxylesterase
MRTASMAGLQVRIAGGTDREGGGSGPVVMLLHGFGARGDDLAPLYRVLDVPREVRFVFPEAPLAPPELESVGGRAWWPVDTLRMQHAIMTGTARDRSRETPAGLEQARNQVLALLDAVERELDVHGEHVVLGGFSQGAMLSLDVALRSERALAGLVLLSTTLLCRAEWEPLMARRRGLPVLMAHGRQDTLLSFAIAAELRDLLQAAGCEIEWHEFNGGHEVPMSVLQAVASFVRRVADR